MDSYFLASSCSCFYVQGECFICNTILITAKVQIPQSWAIRIQFLHLLKLDKVTQLFGLSPTLIQLFPCTYLTSVPSEAGYQITGRPVQPVLLGALTMGVSSVCCQDEARCRHSVFGGPSGGAKLILKVRVSFLCVRIIAEYIGRRGRFTIFSAGFLPACTLLAMRF